MTALNLATVFGPNVFRSVGCFWSSFFLCVCVRLSNEYEKRESLTRKMTDCCKEKDFQLDVGF